MKKFLPIFLYSIIFLASCSKNNDIKTVPQSVTETYKFKSITYAIEKSDDGIKDSAVNVLPIQFSNVTGLNQTVTFSPTKGIQESSLFSSDQQNAFSLSNDSIVVAVPQYITGTAISLGVKKWLYTDKPMQLPPVSQMKDSVVIGPHTLATIKTILTLHKFTATYTATYIGELSGKEITVKGRWVGTVPAGTNITAHFDPL